MTVWLRSNFSMTLSPSQLEVVNCTAPLILVAAGPGSGKSSVLVARVQRLLADGVPPERICLISYTNSSADLLQARLGSVRLGACSTLHSFLLSLIRKHHILIGYRSSNIAALSEEEATKLLKDTMALMKVRATADKMTQAVLNAAVIVPMARIETCGRKYLDAMREMESLSFDGILAYGRVIANLADPGFDHILIDEVQDSTDCDMEIYFNLRIPNKVWVGDFEQSIFSFRGGNALNILKLSQRPDVAVLKLEDNYRSLMKVCNVAEELISHGPARIPKRIIPVRRDSRGAVGFNQFETDTEEYAYLAKAFLNSTEREETFLDLAIICRTNVIVNEIRDRFDALGIPVEKPKRQELPSDWAKALLCVNLCANPNNDHLAKKWLLSEGYGEAGVSRVEILAASCGQSVAQYEGLAFVGITLGTFIKHHREFGWHLSRESSDLISQITNSKHPTDMTQLAWLMAQHTADQTETVPGFFVGTCHSAKGREFGTVFVAGFDDAIIPAKRALAEERRIAFVALTRAKDCCIFTSAKKRKSSYNGEIIESEPSRFLNEMGLI